MRTGLSTTCEYEDGHAQVEFTSWSMDENGEMNFICTKMDPDEARLKALEIIRLADKADEA